MEITFEMKISENRIEKKLKAFGEEYLSVEKLVNGRFIIENSIEKQLKEKNSGWWKIVWDHIESGMIDYVDFDIEDQYIIMGFIEEINKILTY